MASATTSSTPLLLIVATSKELTFLQNKSHQKLQMTNQRAIRGPLQEVVDFFSSFATKKEEMFHF